MAAVRGLTDDELRRRLQAHGFAVPPITASTRSLLEKKLGQFESQKSAKEGGGKRTPAAPSPTSTRYNLRQSTPSKSGSSVLIDYSSAEEDTSAGTSSKAQRRTSTSSRNSRLQSNGGSARGGTPVTSGKSSGGQRRGVINGQASSRSKSLITYSENEDDDDDDDDESEEEVEEEEVEEEDDDDDDEVDDGEDNHRADFCGQTSPSLDDSPATNQLSNGGLHFRGRHQPMISPSPPSPSSSGGRFLSRSPPGPVRSTASYLPSSWGRSQPSAAGSDIISHQLRRTISNNTKDFGSLGEALSSLSSIQRQQPQPSPSVDGITSQASPPSGGKAESGRPKSVAVSSGPNTTDSGRLPTVSKLIIVLAASFFLVIVFMYSSLRPSNEIAHRLPMCETNIVGRIATGPVCVHEHQREDLLSVYKQVMGILEKQSLRKLCPGREGTEASEHKMDSAVSVRQIEYRVLSEHPTQAHEEMRGVLQLLMRLLMENPKWSIVDMRNADGLAVVDDVSAAHELDLLHPPVPWMCWIALRFNSALAFLYLVSGYVMCALAAVCAAAGLVKLYRWRRDRRVQEQQETFELVEQALTVLISQYQMMLREGRGAGSPKSWVAINHIRDQILAPHERARKLRLWQKAVQYIREHESRVREDVQRIYGEEHRVWMWIPDVHFSPQSGMSPPPGSPFFPLGPGASPQSSMTPPGPTGGRGVPYQMAAQASPMPPSPASAASSPSTPLSNWQGAAFNALGKNVASPVVAPTNCLKVRHMFDQALMKMPAWVYLVKEELLKRCAHVADIVHLAVDQESNEGCVYVKALTPDDAGRVFKALHGQWYRGNLVTVKYLREERYHEKFPDSKHQKHPLKTRKSL